MACQRGNKTGARLAFQALYHHRARLSVRAKHPEALDCLGWLDCLFGCLVVWLFVCLFVCSQRERERGREESVVVWEEKATRLEPNDCGRVRFGRERCKN